MRIELKGIHRVISRGRVYYYAWRGGPRLPGTPGSNEFLEAFKQAHASKGKIDTNTVAGLIANYKASVEYTSLTDVSRRDYSSAIKLIEEEFGNMPTAALKDKRCRGIFKDWRAKYSSTPRKADRLWSTLKRIFSVSVDSGLIENNPCSGGGRLYTGSRVSAIWSENDIELMRARSSFPIWAALSLAINTAQRQGDLLKMLWSNISDTHITLTQSKTGKPVKIKISKELQKTLGEIKEHQKKAEHSCTHVLTNSRNMPWTSDGFKTSWGKAVKKAGVNGKTFNDLRGTAITRWAERGATVPQIAALSGHSLKDVETILERHYLSKTQEMGDKVIVRMDRAKRPRKV